jgi:ADP-heptose:LPS heptosyltransferase
MTGITTLFKKIFNKRAARNELDILLEKARQDNAKSFLVPWNRGLGDIALGLYAFTVRVRSFIPDARITFITRSELKEAFSLLLGTEVIGIPWLARGNPIDIHKVIKDLDIKGHDIILENINPTKWLAWQIGTLVPKLKWKDEYDDPWKRFNLNTSVFYIGAHIDTETHQFYGNKKDWPIENWEMLFEKFYNTNVRVILFGLKSTHLFDHPSIIDLRGKTSLLEMLSITKNCCNILIAPDGGVLSITYYLDVYFPIAVISLWGDSNQGILKQAVPSPNTGLKHFPITGKGKNVTKISVDEVFSIYHSLQRQELLP